MKSVFLLKSSRGKRFDILSFYNLGSFYGSEVHDTNDFLKLYRKNSDKRSHSFDILIFVP